MFTFKMVFIYSVLFYMQFSIIILQFKCNYEHVFYWHHLMALDFNKNKVEYLIWEEKIQTCIDNPYTDIHLDECKTNMYILIFYS